MGILLGLILYIFLPSLIGTDFFVNKSFRTYLGFPEGQFFYKSGGVFVVGMLFPTIFGLIGGLLGHLISNKKKNK